VTILINEGVLLEKLEAAFGALQTTHIAEITSQIILVFYIVAILHKVTYAAFDSLPVLIRLLFTSPLKTLLMSS
jgi:hypothetical protein